MNTRFFVRGGFTVLGCVAATAAIFQFAGRASALPLDGSFPAYPHKPGEIVIKYKNHGKRLQSVALSGLQSRLGANSILHVKSLQTDKSLLRVRLADDAAVQDAIEYLKTEPRVEAAEPNYIYHVLDDDRPNGLPNDPEFGKLWGMQNTGQTDAAGNVGVPGADIHVLPLWQEGFTGSRNVLVAVIDTGVDWTHPDLKDNLYTNPGEVEGNGQDDDGNGFIDDIHGWNFANNTNNSVDDNNHGSHCSGTIGGSGNNGIGVVGVNWKVSILPVKFLDAEGSGTLEGAVEAINYARKMKVQIMSNSWGGGPASDVLKTAIEETQKAGILFVAAAGNESNNNDTRPSYPASYAIDNVVSVAATTNKDTIASFSNYGTKTVHVAAPGNKIFSTTKNGGYETFSGTSMATPHVSGIAALMLSIDSKLTYADIKKRLIETSDPVSALKKKVIAKGRVNAYNAVHGIIPPSTDPAESDWQTVEQVVESAHPYANKEDKVFTVQYPNAKAIRVIFERVDMERGYDKLFIQNPKGEVAEEITGQQAQYTSEYVSGDTLLIRMTSDDSVQNWGFRIAKIQVVMKQ